MSSLSGGVFSYICVNVDTYILADLWNTWRNYAFGDKSEKFSTELGWV